MAGFIDIVLILQIFVLLNPLASFPLLIESYKRRMNLKKIAFSAVFTAFVIAIIIALVGPYLFKVFGITLDSFRIAGGIVLLLLGLQMIHARQEKTEANEVNGMVTIIATPLLTGPATISFLTIKSYELGQIPVIINIIGAFVIVAIVFSIFSASARKINPKVVELISRVVGLFLAGVGIEMVSKGIFNAIALI